MTELEWQRRRYAEERAQMIKLARYIDRVCGISQLRRALKCLGMQLLPSEPKTEDGWYWYRPAGGFEIHELHIINSNLDTCWHGICAADSWRKEITCIHELKDLLEEIVEFERLDFSDRSKKRGTWKSVKNPFFGKTPEEAEIMIDLLGSDEDGEGEEEGKKGEGGESTRWDAALES